MKITTKTVPATFIIELTEREAAILSEYMGNVAPVDMTSKVSGVGASISELIDLTSDLYNNFELRQIRNKHKYH